VENNPEEPLSLFEESLLAVGNSEGRGKDAERRFGGSSKEKARGNPQQESSYKMNNYFLSARVCGIQSRARKCHLPHTRCYYVMFRFVP